MKKLNISDKALNISDNCRFCWMCRHICPVGNATGQERNNARARALGVSLVARGTIDISDIIDNVYECTTCGACTNNCVTGWDPKVFMQEVKTEAALQGKTPSYILELVNKYQKSGNVYGKKLSAKVKALLHEKKEKVLFVLGEDALYMSPNSVENACKLMSKIAPFTFTEESSKVGTNLFFLLGKTEEVRNAASSFAEQTKGFDKVVIYDPVDLRFIAHEFNEWGIKIKAKVVSFHDYLNNNAKLLKLKKGKNEYSVQDNYAYARDLNDSETVRKLVNLVGKNKEIFLNKKVANMAGSLLMAQYMEQVMLQVARNRWSDAIHMDCHTLVSECPSEYELLKATAPKGYKVVSLEEMLLDNM